MNKITHYQPTQFAIFHDYDNVRINAKKNSIPVIDLLISYINNFGHIHSYYLFVSNPNYDKEIEDLQNTIMKISDDRFNRFTIVKDYTENSGTDDIDFKICESIYRFVDEYPHITNFIIISGDGDFIYVIRYLEYRDKSVKVFSDPKGTSGLLEDYL